MLELPWLEPGASDFPPSHDALSEPNGLIAVGGDLSPQQLIGAYQRGIFPWYDHSQPILWWTPSPRLILQPEQLHISKSLRKLIKKRAFKVTTDQAFGDVMQACAQPRQQGEGTWITQAMIDAYQALHDQGFAHSVEVWSGGSLVGGLYGIALGKVFFGESMFSLESNASKYGFAVLVQALRALEYQLIDCQVHSDHLASLGAQEIEREIFEQYLLDYIDTNTLNAQWPDSLETPS